MNPLRTAGPWSSRYDRAGLTNPRSQAEWDLTVNAVQLLAQGDEPPPYGWASCTRVAGYESSRFINLIVSGGRQAPSVRTLPILQLNGGRQTPSVRLGSCARVAVYESSRLDRAGLTNPRSESGVAPDRACPVRAGPCSRRSPDRARPVLAGLTDPRSKAEWDSTVRANPPVRAGLTNPRSGVGPDRVLFLPVPVHAGLTGPRSKAEWNLTVRALFLPVLLILEAKRSGT